MAIADIIDELEELELGGPVMAAAAPLVALAPQVAAEGGGPGQPLAQQPSNLALLLKQPMDSLEDIAGLFKAAKRPAEVFAYAQDCATPVWLDWMIKLSPRNVKVQGQLDVRAVFAKLGPVKRKP